MPTPQITVSDATATLTTTGSSQQTLHAVNVPTTVVGELEFRVIARAIGAANVKAWNTSVVFRREPGAAPVVVGSIVDVTTPRGSAGAALWSLTIESDGAASVRCRVSPTGETGDVAWACVARMTAMEVS